MSARATRPRSRRGRQPPPGELDPVAESLEETDAVAGSLEARPRRSLDTHRQQPDPGVQTSDQHLGGRTDHQATAPSPEDGPSAPAEGREPAEDAQQPPEVAPQDGEAAPTVPAAPNVFHSLQEALSSLEIAAAAWRQRPPSCPPAEGAGGRKEGSPGPWGEAVEARSGPREAARLAERNAWLSLALGSREQELARARSSLHGVQAERDALQRQVQELQDLLAHLEASPLPSGCHMGGPSSDSSSSEAEGEPWSAQEDCVLPHPLLRRVRSNSCTPIIGRVSTQPSTPEPHAMESRMKQLRGSTEKLKCFNRLLLAVLQGHKGRCEGLSMQLGQREAEATALCLALQYSEDCEEAYGVLLALTAACCSAPGEEAVVAGARATEVASRLLAEKEAALDGGTPQPSSEGSSVDQPTPWELAARLRSYIQRLRDRRALVQVPSELGPAAEPGSTVPHTEAMVHAILETQPGPTLPRLEKFQIQQELAATREAMTDLMLWLQLLRREKRGLELREAALRAQGPVHALLLQQLRRERAHLGGDSSGGDSSGGDSSGDEALRARGPLTPFGGQTDRVWDSESLPQELAATLDRTLVLRGQLRTLRRELEQAAEKGRAQRAQNAQLTTELCKAHSALALALRGAHRQQEERRSRLEARAARLQARQAEELRVLEATARALGTPGPPRPAAPLGETVL